MMQGTHDGETILSVDNLSIQFNTFSGTVQAVRDVSFILRRGETLAIVGESGSGKSVTTKALLGILPKNGRITSGSILYDGKDMAAFTQRDFYAVRGKRISLVFQDPLSALNPIMKIGKQITEVLILNQKMSRPQARQRAFSASRVCGAASSASIITAVSSACRVGESAQSGR